MDIFEREDSFKRINTFLAHSKKQLGNKMVAILSIFDFLLGFWTSFGRTAVPSVEEAPSALCLAQAFGIQFSEATSVIWIAVISLNFFFVVVKRIDAAKVRRWLKYELCAVILWCGLIEGIAGGVLDLYGDAGIWCAISTQNP